MPLRPPPDVVETAISPLLPAAQIGAVTGFLGLCLGGTVGILRSSHPGFAAFYTGTQCFVLGSSFVYTREASLSFRDHTSPNIRRHELVASALAGTVSGAAAGRFWSRPTSVAGAVTFGILGYIGQGALHKSADKPEAERDRRTFWQKLADSRLSPIKSLSNEDYEKMLHDKLELVNAEIAIVDEKLSELSQAQQNTSKSIG